MFANQKYLQKCIYSCGTLSNCNGHDPNFCFGIVCNKHWANIYESGNFGITREKPKTKIYDGPWLGVTARCEFEKNKIIIPYKKKIDSSFPLLTSTIESTNALNYRIGDQVMNYFNCESYLLSKPDLKMYQIEILRNITVRKEVDIEISKTFDKQEMLKDAVTNVWKKLQTLYDGLPHVKNYVDQIILTDDRTGSMLSPFEKLILFYCNIGGISAIRTPITYYDNINGSNVEIVEDIGWVATEVIEHPTIYFVTGFIGDNIQSNKELRYQRFILENYKCVGDKTNFNNKIPYKNCAIPREPLCGNKYY